MPRIITTQSFIEKANKIHNYFYNYSLVDYIGSLSKIIIICPIHGNFEQTPNNHLRGQICNKCSSIKESANKKLPLKEFISRCTKIHKNKYNYDSVNYDNFSSKIKIFCNKHEIFFEQPVSCHLNNRAGCPKCKNEVYSKVKSCTLPIFIEKAKLIHNDKYNYDNSVYIDNKIKIKILCLNCNSSFLRSPTSHLGGYGCPKCTFKKRKGFSRTQWINYSKNNKADPCVYIIRCFNETENFIKIGITSVTTKKRFSYKRIPYKYEIIKEITGPVEFLYDKEKELQKLFETYKYLPLQYFNGYTECFNILIKDLPIFSFL